MTTNLKVNKNEIELIEYLNLLAESKRSASDIMNDYTACEELSSLLHGFFMSVTSSQTNWSLIRTIGEDPVSVADDCTMKFLMKLDHFLKMPSEKRIKTAVVMGNNLIRDKARSYLAYTKHNISPDDYNWTNMADSTNIERQYVTQEQIGEIVNYMLEKYNPLSTAIFLGITVLRIKPAELSKSLSSGNQADVIRTLITDSLELLELDLSVDHCFLTRLRSIEYISAPAISDLCYEVKRSLRKRFR